MKLLLPGALCAFLLATAAAPAQAQRRSASAPAKVTLCKFVPDEPAKWNQIEVSVSAWKDGLAQGKYEKTCSITPGFERPCRKADCADPWDCAQGDRAQLIAGNVCQCKAGFFGVNGASPCSACPAGSTSTPGSSECVCADGSALIDGVCQCKAGFYSADGNYPCTPCPGISSSTPGSTQCSCSGNSALVGEVCQCLAGFYGADGNFPCTQCPEGASSSAGSSDCTCSDESQLVGTGSEASCQCREGYYGPNGNVPCTPCGSGQTSAAGSTECQAVSTPTSTCVSNISPCSFYVTGDTNRDIYFTLDKPQTLTVSTYGYVDTMVWLYDAAGNLITYNDDCWWCNFTWSLNSFIQAYLEPGTYRLRAGVFVGGYNPDAWYSDGYPLTATLS